MNHNPIKIIKKFIAEITAYNIWKKEFDKLQEIKKSFGMSSLPYREQWKIVCDAYEKLNCPGELAKKIRSDMRKPLNEREFF